MSGSVGAAANYAWDTSCAVAQEVGALTQVFIDKAPKSIEFVYAHFKMIGDTFKPVLESVGYSMGEFGDILVTATKGHLKGFTTFATIGSSFQETWGKVSRFAQSGVFEAGAFFSVAGSVCGTFNKAHDMCSFLGSRMKVSLCSALATSVMRVNFAVLGAGGFFRAVMASDKVYANAYNVEGPLGTRPASSLQYEKAVSGSLSIISNVAAAAIGSTLLLKDLGIVGALAPQILFPIGAIGAFAKLAKYYYDARNGLDGSMSPPPPPQVNQA